MTVLGNKASAITQLLHAPRFVASWFGVALIMAVNFGTLWSVVELHDYETKRELKSNALATDSLRLTMASVNKTLDLLTSTLVTMRATDSLHDRSMWIDAASIGAIVGELRRRGIVVTLPLGGPHP